MISNRDRVTFHGRTFDYVPRLVEANLAHLVRDLPRGMTQAELWDQSIWWAGGPVLDQGREGACVGFGCTGEAMASPVRVQSVTTTVDRVLGANQLALSVYNRAKEIDEWEGVDYEGTSVRAGCLVGRERGWWKSFKWSKNMDEVRQALQLGPVILGVDWREGMYSTMRFGFVRVSGGIVGGHCILLTGYSPNYRDSGPHFRWRNSWGRSYGVNGNGYIKPEDVDSVCFKAGNEAAVVLDRHL